MASVRKEILTPLFLILAACPSGGLWDEDPREDHHFGLARGHEEAGRYREAIAEYERAAKYSDDPDGMQWYIARCRSSFPGELPTALQDLRNDCDVLAQASQVAAYLAAVSLQVTANIAELQACFEEARRRYCEIVAIYRGGAHPGPCAADDRPRRLSS